MHRHKAYQKLNETESTRIDLILRLFERALKYLNLAEADLQGGNKIAAGTSLSRVQIIVTALASGQNGNNELSANLLRLYEFVIFECSKIGIENTQNARKVLTQLYEGFEAARPEALRLEREGIIPHLEREQAIYAKA